MKAEIFWTPILNIWLYANGMRPLHRGNRKLAIKELDDICEYA